MRQARYRYGGQFAAAVFGPLNWVDRKIRSGDWRANLLDLIERRNMCITTSSEYQKQTAALLQAKAQFDATCDQWEAEH
jgi:uncharacterized membrane-anchored protein